MPSDILKHFRYVHLPVKLQIVSKPFHDLANAMDKALSASDEKEAGFRKLLEAKDCMVRAALD